MVDVRSLRLFVPHRLRSLPADLAGAIAMTIAVDVAVFAPVIRETPLRVPLGLAFVLFVPGYVVVAALFPERDGASADAERRTWRSGISGVERVVFSVGLSLVVVPLVGLVLTLTRWGLLTAPFAIGVSAVTLLGTAVAAARRRTVPEPDRFRVPYRTWIATGRAALFDPGTRGDAALNVLLVASILLAAATVGYAVTVPQERDAHSAVALLTETDDGALEFVDGERAQVGANESEQVVLRIDNHEHRTTTYTVVVATQDAEVTDDGVVVHEQREIERFETGLEHGETRTHEHDLEPTTDGDRIVWLVYPDDVPEDPSTENAPYAVDYWLESDDGAAANAGDE